MQFKEIRPDAFATGTLNQGPTIPWYDATRSNNPMSAGNTPGLELGASWNTIEPGNQYQFVFLDDDSGATYAAGTVVTFSLPTTDTVVAAGSTTATIKLGTGNLVVNGEVGNYVYFSDTGETRLIKGNAAASVTVALKTSLVGNNVFDPDVLTAVPANGSALSIIRPFHVKLGAAGAPPTGILLNDVVTGQRVIVQTGGLAFVLGTNTGAALVAGTPAISIASGLITGGSASGFRQQIIPLAAYNSATNILVACYVSLT